MHFDVATLGDGDGAARPSLPTEVSPACDAFNHAALKPFIYSTLQPANALTVTGNRLLVS